MRATAGVVHVWPADPPELFDLALDPDEMQTLSVNRGYADKMASFTRFINARWSLERFNAKLREW